MNGEALARMKESLGAKSLAEVADILGESIGTVKSWSARGSVPLSALIRASKVSGRSLDWLILGIERHPAAGGPEVANAATSPHSQLQPAAAEPPPAAYTADRGQNIDRGRLVQAIDAATAVGRIIGKNLDPSQIGELAGVIYRLMR